MASQQADRGDRPFADVRGWGLVLGAGFSAGLSSHMPTLSELRQLVLAELDERSPTAGAEFRALVPASVELEEGLTWLVEDQPFASHSDTLRRRALFFELQAAIAVIIRRREWLAFADLKRSVPRWARVILDFAHIAHAPVATFNYDTLFERLTGARRLSTPSGEGGIRNVEPAHLIAGEAPKWHGVFGGPGVPFAAATSRLYKLHGSTDWFWYPGESTSGFERRPYDLNDQGEFSEEFRLGLGRRDSFVVPPTWSKAPYLAGTQLRDVWAESATRLREVSKVAVLGYSLPRADTVASALLHDVLRAKVEEVVIADLAPQGVKQRMIQLGCKDDAVRSVDSTAPFEALADQMGGILSAAAASEVATHRDEGNSRCIAIGLNWQSAITVTHATRDGSTVVLHAASMRPTSQTNLVPATAPADHWQTIRGVPLAQLPKGPITRLLIEMPDGERLHAAWETFGPADDPLHEPKEWRRRDWFVIRPLGLDLEHWNA